MSSWTGFAVYENTQIYCNQNVRYFCRQSGGPLDDQYRVFFFVLRSTFEMKPTETIDTRMVCSITAADAIVGFSTSRTPNYLFTGNRRRAGRQSMDGKRVDDNGLRGRRTFATNNIEVRKSNRVFCLLHNVHKRAHKSHRATFARRQKQRAFGTVLWRANGGEARVVASDFWKKKRLFKSRQTQWHYFRLNRNTSALHAIEVLRFTISNVWKKTKTLIVIN